MKSNVTKNKYHQFAGNKLISKYHLDRVAEWIQTGKSRPITAEMDMTIICNHRCPRCVGYIGRDDVVKKGRTSIDFEKAKEIIKALHDYGIKAVIFVGGGESLINPATIKVIPYAKSLGLELGMITNGSLLDDEKCKIILENLIWIRISLDAGNAEMYKKTHGMDENEFNKVVNNIRKLIETKKRLNSNCTIGIGYLTGEDTLSGMLECAKLCKSLGVDYLQFRPFESIAGGPQIKMNVPGTIEEIKKCEELSDDKFKVLSTTHKYKRMQDKILRPYAKCYGPNFTVTVGGEGKLYICCQLKGMEKYCYGDLYENTFKECWEGEIRKKIMETLTFEDCPFLCRCDSFNRALWDLVQNRVHSNFL